MLLHDMSMAETYNENMKKSKEYRRWLQAKTNVNMYSSSKRRFYSCAFSMFFFELGSLMPGCYEGLSHMSSSGSNCGNDRRHDERVQAREKLLQKLTLLDGMTKRDGNRGLGQRKIDWHLIDSAGGESKSNDM